MHPTSFRLQAACHHLKCGGLVAYPTEAVWGLGCDPLDEQAVRRLLLLKARDEDKGLILVAADIAQFAGLLEGLPKSLISKLRLSWPGPTTWLVPHHDRVPSWLTGQHETLAVRVSAHPTVIGLCRMFGGPLVSTSANVAGCQPSREQFQVRRYFGGELDYLMPGRVNKKAAPSVIRDLLTDRIVRS